MSPDALQIACIADGAFLRHAGAMLHSALTRTAPAQAVVHVLHERENAPDDVARLESVVGGCGGSVRWHRVSADAAIEFPRAGNFPRAVWFRVLLPELLPELERVLYLDADTIVTDSLLGLWQTDLGEHLFGAVTNPMYPFMPPYASRLLGIDDPAEYMNSGVLLMNLRKMREEHTARTLIDYANAHPQLLWYADQDAFNVACRGRWLHLHPRWNVQTTMLVLPVETLPLPREQALQARAHPAVIHYIGPWKPWTYMCKHPLQHLYFEHARATPWGAPALEGRTLRHVVLRPLPMRAQEAWFDFERWFKRKWAGLRRRLGA